MMIGDEPETTIISFQSSAAQTKFRSQNAMGLWECWRLSVQKSYTAISHTLKMLKLFIQGDIKRLPTRVFIQRGLNCDDKMHLRYVMEKIQLKVSM